ncbi:MAG: glutaminyl-tRNA synthase (glutamine-hydrolyzing) subunit A [Sulfuricurvum sp. GWF2_44_89]|uniref:Glutamyl-tRNA(Gln) amidotransferase subunit A n=1 Tax=Sulfuricurvum kujiense TaxID=148813 RepID=A0A2D3WDB3_9BACT|nr:MULTISPECIES: Asp-tRNA(Asn)/Glu-tRNA(Gln) amidotransferase subunit GatA [Sulfuricurvum]OHD78018.1 MAG: glutaminyl-tRNA synthase (glutamine-hydrolyzing) subunit A [Sulfuricurvum sp. GWF2_44_89]OHD92220.1 MAG: glutaminyl-tRNA synthase (glutamine-hydrolyzing) subunit A [Sulfuricurvum sp. RIFOXYD2_FULL_44_160]OHD96639.1 MAG: glutaminyl-tRNA synthase (glutamine-hydrolyzing) subunit A [Sulfuricurvum sp. RIFOXYD12_FULL_44_77]DAB39292.1 MAG TPA: Asp-tRNA(Asn)/Glu-tRNA(Gln) amidotransferase GatCAB su
MITLKEALKLSKEELNLLKDELKAKIAANPELNAYIDVLNVGEGIPIAIKDNIQVTGWSVTSGSNILKGYIAPYNATVIEKLLANNMSPFGRTNMDEFAMGSTTESSCYGKTLNPLNHNCVPGGSSGGSAAAVAAGLAVAALGSDTGGSIRQPAAFCGIVGMKPTYGRVSRYGLGAYASSLDQIGPMTQNVEDAAILYDIIQGHDPKDSTSAERNDGTVSDKLDRNVKLKIAVVPDYVKDASEDVRKAYTKAIEALKNAGHTIVEKSLMDPKYDISAYYITATAEATTNLARYDGIRYGNRVEGENLKDTFLQTRSQGFGAEVQRRIMLGNFVLSSGYYDAYYVKAQKVRSLIQEEYNKIFEEVDLILTPVAPRTAYEFGALSDPLEMYLSDIYTISVNLAGLPAISIPVDTSDNGMPVGLQLIAAPYAEQTLFNGALSLETQLQG